MRVCAECQKENQPHYRFCLGCGADCNLKVPDASAARCPHCNAPR